MPAGSKRLHGVFHVLNGCPVDRSGLQRLPGRLFTNIGIADIYLAMNEMTVIAP